MRMELKLSDPHTSRIARADLREPSSLNLACVDLSELGHVHLAAIMVWGHGTDAPRRAKHIVDVFESARAVVKAALAYDAAIQRRAVDGEVNLSIPATGIAQGNDLDALYSDWISKAEAAKALMGEKELCLNNEPQ